MAKFSMKYTGEGEGFGFYLLGCESAEFVRKNTMSQGMLPREGGLEGTGPGGRRIRITYNDLLAEKDNNIHQIEITDPEDEASLAEGLRSLYEKYNFSLME